MITRLLIFLCLLLEVPLCAQDLHFSQFYNQPMSLNPAATGVFQGDVRGAANYRSQWTSVPVSYQTFSGAFDWKPFQWKAQSIALGFLLQHDVAGDGALSWTQVGVSGSVMHALSATQGISAGFGLGVAQRSVDISKLKFQNQWGGDLYDPNLATKENFGNRSNIQPTLSVGLQWFWQSVEQRSHVKAGFGILHLNRPDLSFSEYQTFRLPMRVTFHINCALQLSEWLDLIVFGMAQQLGSSREMVYGAGLRRILSNAPGNFLAARFSLANRMGDAFIPAVQIERNNWTDGVSYDWNTSAFQNATSKRGGVEVSVVYQLLPAPPLKSVKTCPIF